MSVPDIASAMNAAMSEEDRRRRLASESPGLGSLLDLPQSPAGPSVGKAGLMPAVGEGLAPVPYVPQSKSYGPPVPAYAHDLVGGYDFVGGRNEAPIRRHIANLGADGLFIEGASAPAADPYVFATAPARPSLWQRITGKLRRK